MGRWNNEHGAVLLGVYNDGLSGAHRFCADRAAVMGSHKIISSWIEIPKAGHLSLPNDECK